MTLLKDDSESMGYVKAKIKDIPNLIKDINTQSAIKLTNWLHEKAKYSRKHHLNYRLHRVPDNMKRGDIVRVNFGINIGDEFNDDGTDKHFGLIWGQQGKLFIIIPLTKTPQPQENKYGVNLGKIDGLPIETDTWAKIEGIRSISIWRIVRMNEQPTGKLEITNPEKRNEIIKKIKEKFKEKFLDGD